MALQAGAAAFDEEQRARNVITLALPAYTYVAGVITGNAVGAMGAQDTVVNVAGDIVFLPGGIATALAHQGAYVVTAPGTAATVMVLTRVGWMPEAAVLFSGFQVRMGGEGAVFQNTIWQAMLAANTFIVGTTNSEFFPIEVSGQNGMGGGAPTGTFTIANIPILSALSSISLTRTSMVTAALTVEYVSAAVGAPAVSGITPGVLGTGAVRVEAAIAAGTINAADGSTLNWTIYNGQR